jgi:uncharacterized protein
MSALGLTLVGLAIAVGIVGVVVPVLPGALLVWAAVLVWALIVQEPEGWLVLGVSSVAIAATQVLKYVVPARRLRGADVAEISLVLGLIVGVIGFFIVPVVGLFLGFPVGVFVGELLRLGDHRGAWDSTRAALGNVLLSIMIELFGALVAGGVWLAVVLVTA